MKEYRPRIVDKILKDKLEVKGAVIGEFAYRREDGIYIVPIGCLKN